MINNVRGNTLFIGIVLFLAAYAGIGSITPKPYIFKVVAITLTIAGFYMVLIYAKAAWSVLWQRQRAELGAHLKVVGVEFLGIGLLYSGVYRALWDWVGQPPSWTLTWYSSLGSVVICMGAFFVTISPAEIMGGVIIPRFFWFMAAGAILFVSGVVTGSYLL